MAVYFPQSHRDKNPSSALGSSIWCISHVGIGELLQATRTSFSTNRTIWKGQDQCSLRCLPNFTKPLTAKHVGIETL